MSPGTMFKFGRPRAMSRLNAGVRPIALEFGVTALRALQVSGGSPPSLVAAASVETPEKVRCDTKGRLAWQLDQVPKLLRSGGFKGRKAVCVVPATATFCKHMQFTPSDGVGLGAIVENALPLETGQPAESLVMRHQVVAGAQLGAGRQEVICMATPRELVVQMMQALKGAKLQPVGIHTEFQALLRAMAPEDEEPTLYLDLGWTSSKAVIGRGTELVFARTIDCGARQLDEMIAQLADCGLSQATAVRLSLRALTHEQDAPPPAPSGEQRRAAGEPGAVEGDSFVLLRSAERAGQGRAEQEGRDADAEAAAGAGGEAGADAGAGGEAARPRCGLTLPRGIDLSEPLEILADEVLMCLRYHESLFAGKPVRRVVFVGGESRHGAFCEAVARRLALPAQCADPTARMSRSGREPSEGVDFSQPQPGWAVALGACLSPTDL